MAIDYFKLGNAAINMPYSDELLEFAQQIHDRYLNVVVEVKETYPIKNRPRYEIAVRHASSGHYTPLFTIQNFGESTAHVLSTADTNFNISLVTSRFETALAHCVRSLGTRFTDTLQQVNSQLDRHVNTGNGTLCMEDFLFHGVNDVDVTFQLLGRFGDFADSVYTGKAVDIWVRPKQYVEDPEQFHICNMSDFHCVCAFKKREENGDELLYSVTILKEASTAIHRFTGRYKYFPVTKPKNTEI